MPVIQSLFLIMLLNSIAGWQNPRRLVLSRRSSSRCYPINKPSESTVERMDSLISVALHDAANSGTAVDFVRVDLPRLDSLIHVELGKGSVDALAWRALSVDSTPSRRSGGRPFRSLAASLLVSDPRGILVADETLLCLVKVFASDRLSRDESFKVSSRILDLATALAAAPKAPVALPGARISLRLLRGLSPVSKRRHTIDAWAPLVVADLISALSRNGIGWSPDSTTRTLDEWPDPGEARMISRRLEALM